MAKYGPENFVLKNGKTVVFKHCSADEAHLFPEFQQQIANETTNTMQMVGQSSSQEKIKDVWKQSEEDSLYLRLGVFYKHRLIGQLGFRPLTPIHPWTKHIGQFGMMILKEFWGQGIGARMLKIQDDHARLQGLTRIEATVRVQNDRGVNLYKKAGFHIEGLKKCAAVIENREQDEYFIAKIFVHNSEKQNAEVETFNALKKEKRMDDAYKFMIELIHRNQKNAYYHYLAASLCDTYRTEAEAVPFYNKALELGLSGLDRRDAFLGLASTYRSLGEYAKSKDIFERGLREFPDYRPYRVFLALTEYNLKKPNKAVRLLLNELIDTTFDRNIQSYERAFRFYADKLDKVFE